MDELRNQVSTYFSEVLNKLGAAAISDEGAASAFAALNRQCTPAQAEKNVLECELDDPLGARKFMVTPQLVRQYKNRCLLLTTCHCFTYCRFCFRRSFTGKSASFVSAEEIRQVTEWLSGH